MSFRGERRENMINCLVKFHYISSQSDWITYPIPPSYLPQTTDIEASVNQVEIINFVKPTNQVISFDIKFPNLSGGSSTQTIRNPNYAGHTAC